MDSGYVLRGSVGRIEGGRLIVISGPLVGQESYVEKIDRHRRSCRVRVACSDGTSFREVMALEVPSRN